MKQATINIYTYDELSDSAKERARNSFWESDLDLAFSDFQRVCQEALAEQYGIDGEVYYSLSYSQGDGLHFNTDNILTEEILRKLVEDYIELGHKERAKEMGEALIKLGFTIKVKSKNRHYEYASMYDIEMPDGYDVIDSLKENLPEQFANVPYTLLESDYEYFTSGLQTLYLDICKTFETAGYECYSTAEEMVEEDCHNSYFTLSGSWHSEKDD